MLALLYKRAEELNSVKRYPFLRVYSLYSIIATNGITQPQLLAEAIPEILDSNLATVFASIRNLDCYPIN